VNGSAVEVADQIAIETSSSTTIELTTFANACTSAQAGMDPTNGGYLKLELENGEPPAAGTYMLGSDVKAEFKSYADCVKTKFEATSGSITVTLVSSSTLSGSFDLTLETNEHITGTFAAPVCANVAEDFTCQ
jgi:hypothetical protein